MRHQHETEMFADECVLPAHLQAVSLVPIANDTQSCLFEELVQLGRAPNLRAWRREFLLDWVQAASETTQSMLARQPFPPSS